MFSSSSIPTTSRYEVVQDNCRMHPGMRCLCIREIPVVERVPEPIYDANLSFIVFNPNKPDSTIWKESYYAVKGIGSRRGSAWRISNDFMEKGYKMISDKEQEIYFTKLRSCPLYEDFHVRAPCWALNDNRSGDEEGWKVIYKAPKNQMAITNKTNYIVKIVFDSLQELIDSGLQFKSQEIFPGKSILVNSS